MIIVTPLAHCSLRASYNKSILLNSRLPLVSLPASCLSSALLKLCRGIRTLPSTPLFSPAENTWRGGSASVSGTLVLTASDGDAQREQIREQYQTKTQVMHTTCKPTGCTCNTNWSGSLSLLGSCRYSSYFLTSSASGAYSRSCFMWAGSSLSVVMFISTWRSSPGDSFRWAIRMALGEKKDKQGRWIPSSDLESWLIREKHWEKLQLRLLRLNNKSCNTYRHCRPFYGTEFQSHLSFWRFPAVGKALEQALKN